MSMAFPGATRLRLLSTGARRKGFSQIRVGCISKKKMEGNLKMIHTARIINVLKRYFKRLMPGKAETLVRTLADEGRVEKQADPAVDRLNQSRQNPACDGRRRHPSGLADGRLSGCISLTRYPPGRVRSCRKITWISILVSLDDLEACAEELTLPAESIESWVGAGILSPRETEIAERLIRIMRARDQKRGHDKTHSDD